MFISEEKSIPRYPFLFSNPTPHSQCVYIYSHPQLKFDDVGVNDDNEALLIDSNTQVGAPEGATDGKGATNGKPDRERKVRLKQQTFNSPKNIRRANRRIATLKIS